MFIGLLQKKVEEYFSKLLKMNACNEKSKVSLNLSNDVVLDVGPAENGWIEGEDVDN